MTPPPRRHRRPGDRALVVLIGCYLLLQPLSTDLYLASLPGLGRTFAASAATVQLTLSVFVLAFGAMQLVVGPVSDRWGRYPVLVAGLGLYAAAALGCAFAPTMEWLIAGRFAQAIGCCAAVVVARALIRDVYEPAAGARVMAQASTILAVGALAGPIVGSALEVRFAHRGAFVVVALVTAAVLVATLRLMGETLHAPDPRALHPRRLAATYARVLRSAPFRAYTLAASMSYGGLFAFISGSSYVLIRVLGVPTADFGFCFACCVFGYLLGTLACRWLVARSSLAETMRSGAGLALASGAALAGFALAGVHHWAAIVLPMTAYFFAHGIVLPCAQTGAVAPFPEAAGTAAGLLGFLMMVLASVVGAWIGASFDGTVYPLALTIAACSVLLFATVHGWVMRLPAASMPAR